MTDTAATCPYGVLGRVLGHSYTPTIYKELAGLEYVRFEREPEDLAAFMTGDEWEGTNVTIPYKRAVMEYLDERFPHPPLMPVYPVARGNSRLMMHRIELDWYSLADKIMAGTDTEAARAELRDNLLAIAPIFGEMPYFMSEEFGLVDCYMAPLLWRLPSLGIDFTGRGAKELKAYMVRLFERESFQASLTEAEREIRASV